MSILNTLYSDLEDLRDELMYAEDMIEAHHDTIRLDIWMPYLKMLSESYLTIDGLMIKEARRVTLAQLEGEI